MQHKPPPSYQQIELPKIRKPETFGATFQIYDDLKCSQVPDELPEQRMTECNKLHLKPTSYYFTDSLNHILVSVVYYQQYTPML